MKQALTEALAEYTPNPGITPSDSEKRAELDRYWEQRSTILAAARLVERLLPGECPNNCDTWYVSEGPAQMCVACHGTGQLWDEGIVEAVAKVLQDNPVRAEIRNRPDSAGASDWPDSYWQNTARAVLSALVELLTEKAET